MTDEHTACELPLELLALVLYNLPLHHLPNAAAVSTAWRDAADEPVSWSRRATLLNLQQRLCADAALIRAPSAASSGPRRDARPPRRRSGSRRRTAPSRHTARASVAAAPTWSGSQPTPRDIRAARAWTSPRSSRAPYSPPRGGPAAGVRFGTTTTTTHERGACLPRLRRMQWIM